MPKLQKIIDERLARYNDVPDALVSSVDAAQRKLLKEIDSIFATLDTVDGKIALSESNLKKIGVITEDLKKVFLGKGSDYIEAVKSFAGEFSPQAKLTVSQYKAMGLDVALADDKILAQMLKNSTQEAVLMLNENAVENVLLTPIRQALNQSVSAEASYMETMKTMRTFINGNPTIEGNVKRYIKQTAYDLFATSDRAYSQKINEDLGLEFYRYVGGRLPDTRCFCAERNGKYFHKKEIEGWGIGKDIGGDCGYPWQGMRKGTNSQTIFQFVGGYSCKHSLIPVMQEVVEGNALARARSKGYIK